MILSYLHFKGNIFFAKNDNKINSYRFFSFILYSTRNRLHPILFNNQNNFIKTFSSNRPFLLTV